MSADPDPITISLAELEQFIARALGKVGMPEADAALTATLMAQSDLHGIDTHGVSRLPNYIKRIHAGGMNLTPDIKIVQEAPATALVDGDNAMGHLVVARAADIAIAKAKAAGIGWVGVRNSNHAGPAMLYARMPLAHDMIGIYGAVGSANHLPPWGGTEMLLSTNPISIAVPASRHQEIVLDMATTVASYGKVKAAALRGEPMPEGWMIDAQGRPITDPTKASDGFLLPIGGPKGYGLALMLGILAGTLNGAAMGRDVIDFNAEHATVTNTGQFVCAISVGAFMEIEAFGAAVDTVIETMKSSPTLPGFDEVRLPGERSAKLSAERRKSGIPVHPAQAKILAALAEDLGIAKLA